MPGRAAIGGPLLADNLHVGYSRHEASDVRLIEVSPLDLFLVNHLILLGDFIGVFA